LLLKQFLGAALLTSIMAIGGTITITGPEDVNGNPCTPPPSMGLPGSPGCIVGDPTGSPIYTVFKVSITSPTTPTGLWTVSIDTDYGVNIVGDTSIPTYSYLQTGLSFGIGDVLFSWNGNDYGLVLTPHDGYSAGNLYEANSFQTSQAVLSGGGVPQQDIFRPTQNVLLGAPTGPNPNLQGTGTISVTANPGADGFNDGLYTITDSFHAPANFLDSAFTVTDASYDCANGYLSGSNGGGFTLGTGGNTPEPGSWLLILPGLVLLGVARMRKRRI
jgi:hypothetical protein